MDKEKNKAYVFLRNLLNIDNIYLVNNSFSSSFDIRNIQSYNEGMRKYCQWIHFCVNSFPDILAGENRFKEKQGILFPEITYIRRKEAYFEKSEDKIETDLDKKIARNDFFFYTDNDIVKQNQRILERIWKNLHISIAKCKDYKILESNLTNCSMNLTLMDVGQPNSQNLVRILINHSDPLTETEVMGQMRGYRHSSALQYLIDNPLPKYRETKSQLELF